MLNDEKVSFFLGTTAFSRILGDEKRYKKMLKTLDSTSCGSGKKYKKCCGRK